MKIIFLITFLSVVVFSSCNKWLDVDLADKVTEEKMFSSPQGFNEALGGVYSAIAAPTLYGQSLTMENIDLLAQYYNYDGVSSTYEKFKNYDYEDAGSQSRIAAIWKNMYAAISGANNIIKWANKTTLLTEDMKNKVLGEAYGLRAFLHLDIIRMFCPDVKKSPKANGIPYNLEFGVSLPPVYTVEEGVQLVVNDLKEAEKHLSISDPINSVKPYEMSNKNDADKYVARINLYGVKALLARVSLMRGDKASAIKYAKEVIESGKFRLLDFASTDKSDKEIDILFSDEHIFSLRNPKLSDYTIYLHYPEITASTSRGAYLPFANIYTLYEGNNDDVRYIKWFSVVNNNFVKFNVDNKEKFFPKMPMIKLSEMYLILSESYLGNDDLKAQSYVNTLRTHRIRNNTNWGYLTMDYLIQEAKREFIGEGQLWYLFKRLDMGVPTSSGVVGVVPPSDKIFVFPIPLKEIETGNRN